MRNILVLGAGRSSTSLIKYLNDHAATENWQVTICEKIPALARSKFPETKVIEFDINDREKSIGIIQNADLVISMLPATLHFKVAEICALEGIHLLTASYLKDDIKSLNEDFKSKGAICLMETGLDPGLDHMSAMKVLDRIKNSDAELTGFETFTGGLLAENKEKDNPWHYKFTWNPRNVVMAGSGYVKFIQEGRFKYIPYHQLFRRTEIIHIPGYGHFEGYANRDSLIYLDLYDLKGIQTLFRGTLRRPGFCRAWNIFVMLGATDDGYEMEDVSNMTHRQFLNSFLRYNPHDSVELKLAHYLNLGLESEEMYKLQWLGMFDEEPIGLDRGTPAQILEHILNKKWKLDPTDRDMIVMWHKFDFIQDGRPKQIQSHMVVEGENDVDTGMSKTVGLPLAIAAKLILNGEIKKPGVHTPTKKDLYEPILNGLGDAGFEFVERETMS